MSFDISKLQNYLMSPKANFDKSVANFHSESLKPMQRFSLPRILLNIFLNTLLCGLFWSPRGYSLSTLFLAWIYQTIIWVAFPCKVKWNYSVYIPSLFPVCSVPRTAVCTWRTFKTENLHNGTSTFYLSLDLFVHLYVNLLKWSLHSDGRLKFSRMIVCNFEPSHLNSSLNWLHKSFYTILTHL